MESGSSQEILISLVHYPLLVLGPGRRLGIWTQGCSIHCQGCISRHTWEPMQGERITIARLLERIEPHLDGCDGVTISGGEPFDQPAALAMLVEALRLRGIADILLYSGYRYELLRDRYPEILGKIAALVDGEFVLGDESIAKWKGSDNQRLIILSRDTLLQQRYGVYSVEPGQEMSMQIISSKGKIVVVGIPRQRDAEAIINGVD